MYTFPWDCSIILIFFCLFFIRFGTLNLKLTTIQVIVQEKMCKHSQYCSISSMILSDWNFVIRHIARLNVDIKWQAAGRTMHIFWVQFSQSSFDLILKLWHKASLSSLNIIANGAVSCGDHLIVFHTMAISFMSYADFAKHSFGRGIRWVFSW